MIVKLIFDLFDLGEPSKEFSIIQEIEHISGICEINAHEIPIETKGMQTVYR